MERLTDKDGLKACYCNGKYFDKLNGQTECKHECQPIHDALIKLQQFEDLEEKNLIGCANGELERDCRNCDNMSSCIELFGFYIDAKKCSRFKYINKTESM